MKLTLLSPKEFSLLATAIANQLIEDKTKQELLILNNLLSIIRDVIIAQTLLL